MDELIKNNLKIKLRVIFDFISNDVFNVLEDETKFNICTYFSNSLVNEYYAKQIQLDDECELVLGEAILYLDYNFSKSNNKPRINSDEEMRDVVATFAVNLK